MFFNCTGFFVESKRAMFATAFAAITSFQMVGFRKNDKSLFTKVVFFLRQGVFLLKSGHFVIHSANLLNSKETP